VLFGYLIPRFMPGVIQFFLWRRWHSALGHGRRAQAADATYQRHRGGLKNGRG
jgi:hypothetical protein